MPKRTGILFVVSGPSGSGKTTLCRRLAEEGLASYSISCTTRAPRPGERDGVDYFFRTREDFERGVEAGEFIEHAEVHGNLYGTLKAQVLDKIAQGRDVVLDIDVQGAAQVRGCADPLIRGALVDLFVMPAGEEELRARLDGRGTDSAEVIALRLTNALEEIAHWPEYRYRLVSTTREEDYASFRAVLLTERLKVGRLHSEEV
jgi:guanylate kinase